jgi:hypothetical protein
MAGTKELLEKVIMIIPVIEDGMMEEQPRSKYSKTSTTRTTQIKRLKIKQPKCPNQKEVTNRR